MEKTNTSRTWRIIGLAFGISCVAVVGSSLWLPHSQSSSQDDLPQIRNETASFQLVSQEKRGAFLVLTMRNVSAKGITAYSVSGDPNGREDMDYAIGGHVIKPGDIEEIEFSLSSLDKAYSAKGKKSQIRILAVVFDDHTSEGNPGVAAMIRENRLGKKIQLKRINRLIREALRSLDANSSNVLGSLKSDIASLPEDADKDQSSYVHDGLHSAKQDILGLIEELEQKENARGLGALTEHPRAGGTGLFLREGLDKIIQESEKWVGRY
jgi:hypothetical protein